MKNYKIEIKWSSLFAVMTLLWTVIEKTAGFHDERIASQPAFGAFILIPAIIIYILALREKRNDFYGGVISYRKGLLSGTILSIIIGVLSTLTTFINLKVISPEYLSNAAEYAVLQGKMTLTQAKEQFSLSGYIITGAIAAVVTGIIITAVVILFLRRADDGKGGRVSVA